MKRNILIALVAFICIIGIFTGVFIAVLSNNKQKQNNLENKNMSSKQSTEAISSQQPKEVSTIAVQPKATSSVKIKSDSIATPFGSPQIGTKFNNAPSNNKLPRLVGTTKDQMALLEISGKEDDIDKISMAVAIVKDRQDLFERGSFYMMGLVKNALPSWTEGPQWVLASLNKVVKTANPSSSITYENFRVTLNLDLKLHVFLLTIEKI